MGQRTKRGREEQQESASSVTKPIPMRKTLGLATVERAARRIVQQDRGVLGLATVASAVRAKTAPWSRTAAWACGDVQNLTQPAATSECTNAVTYYSEIFGHRLLDHGGPAVAMLSRLPAQRPRAICDHMMVTHGYFTTDQMDVRQWPPQIFSTRREEIFEAEIMLLSPLVDDVVGVTFSQRQQIP